MQVHLWLSTFRCSPFALGAQCQAVVQSISGAHRDARFGWKGTADSWRLQADLWSLGIILFELFASKPPFFTNNVYTLIKQIINNRITYPLGTSPEFRNFLEVCST